MDLSFDEQVAASAVAALGGMKRNRDDSPDAAGGVIKRGRTSEGGDPMEEDAAPRAPMVPLPAEAQVGVAAAAPQQGGDQPELKPFPYFYYRDFSKEVDPDPLVPLTPPGRVPNFPAKMHSILSRPDLADIICWMPHGRAWRVLKPREFEIRVIPTYFEHAKFSSFIRQANGWGFRRVTQGRDRNCYYHELFLRGLPHLCKSMKRPAVSEKQPADPEHEPDFYKISESFPVPEKAEDDSILLQCTLEGGPKARMPIYSGAFNSSKFSFALPSSSETKPASAAPAVAESPANPIGLGDQGAMSSFQQALGASESQFKTGLGLVAIPQAATPAHKPSIPVPIAAPAFSTGRALNPFSLSVNTGNKVSALAAANQLAFASPSQPVTSSIPDMAAAQFAAGFAAATALSQHQLQSVLGSFSFAPQTTSPPSHQGQPIVTAHGFQMPTNR